MSWRAEFKRFMAAASSTVLGMMLLCCMAAVNASGDQPSVEPNDLRWDLAENFEFRWTTVDLSTKVIRGDVANSFERNLTISGRLVVLDVEGLVTIEWERPWTLSVSDAHGNAVPYEFEQWPAGRWYETNGWRLNSGSHASWSCPFALTLRFPENPDEPVPSSLGELVGYVYVLFADDVLFLDIPFDPDGGWHELEAAPDLELCIDPTTPPCPEPLDYLPIEMLPGTSIGLEFPFRPTTPVPLYSYTTYVRSKSGAKIMALRDRTAYYYRDSCPLGDYAILRTELYDSVGQTSVIVPTQDTKSGFSSISGAWCRGQVEQGRFDAYDTIRHVIVVDPVEVKIPFVLSDIPILGTEVTDK
jgi:hypothetical protein